MKVFELTIPPEQLDIIHKEIKNPKRPDTELLELWLERELRIENEGTYGNLPVDESHVTIQLLSGNRYKMTISDTVFSMIKWHVQPEPHSHRMSDVDVLHVWLDMKTDMLHAKEHIEVKALPSK